ncbi:MAG: 30S ribosomal protein S9 [Candidatus Neomarinimicrobiota bacterium]|nr:MAG: 30S ribosomal protein S9 [Candidatus Neomarinimicrobiota bacterium]
MAAKAVYQGTGRRKSSVARVYLTPGKGEILINGRPYDEYLSRKSLAILSRKPLEVLGVAEEYDIKANVHGGGLTGQAGAVQLGISRALLQVNADFRQTLKSHGFLTRDARRVERKKYGQPGARKRFQFSKR